MEHRNSSQANDPDEDLPYDPAAGRRKLGLMPMFLLCAAAFVVIPTIAFMSWGNYSKLRFEAQVQKLQEKGVPSSAATLNEFYSLPEDFDDSTQLYLEAIRVVASKPFENAVDGIPVIDVEMPPTGSEWPNMDKVASLVGEFQTTLDVLHEAARQGGHARFQIEFDDGYSALLEHVQNLRLAVRFQQVEVALHSHNKDAAKAFTALKAGFATSTCLKHEPVVVSQLVSIACVKMMLASLEDALAKIQFNEDQLADLQSTIQEIDLRSVYRNAWNSRRNCCWFPPSDLKIWQSSARPLISCSNSLKKLGQSH